MNHVLTPVPAVRGLDRLTLDQAAELLRVSVATLQEAAADPRAGLPQQSDGEGGAWFWREELLAWLASA